MDQLGLFEADELLEGNDLLEYNAKLYTVNRFIHTCSNRDFTKNAIEKRDYEEARKWFFDTCKKFGFSSPQSYSFNGYGGKAIIRYYDKENNEKNIKCSFNELFNFLIENYQEAVQLK